MHRWTLKIMCVSRLQEFIWTAHEVARNVLRTHEVHMKRNHDMKIHTWEYAVGVIVHVLDAATFKGRSKKLDPPWKGPGIIVQKLSWYLYKVKLQEMVFTTYLDRLKKCNDRKVTAWLRRFLHRLQDGQNVLESESACENCICRKPDDGRFVIQCDSCDTWYHGVCFAITQEIADTLKTYICPWCQVVEKS